MDWNRLLVWAPQIVLLTLLLTMTLAFAYGTSASSKAYGPYNDQWDGTADVREFVEQNGHDVTVALDTTYHNESNTNETVAFVLQPVTTYSGQDSAQLRQFLTQGGRLVIAAENGSHANQLLEALGSRARIDGRVLRDEQSHYRSPALPIAVPRPANLTTAQRSFLEGVSSITLNHGATVVPNGAETIFSTQKTSYLDTNGNGSLDDDESLGRHTVVSLESVGAGQLIVTGDPSLFTNAMLTQDGNQAFLQALTADRERVFLDMSHGGPIPPLPYVLLTVQRSPVLQVIVGLMILGGYTTWLWFPREWVSRLWDRDQPDSPHELDESALHSALQSRHPEWDDGRLNRVTKAIIRRRRQARDDE